MEIRIGVLNTSREIVLDANLSADAIEQAVAAALKNGTPLTLNDDKGRSVVVPAAAIAYVDIAATETRRVGFGS